MGSFRFFWVRSRIILGSYYWIYPVDNGDIRYVLRGQRLSSLCMPEQADTVRKTTKRMIRGMIIKSKNVRRLIIIGNILLLSIK